MILQFNGKFRFLSNFYPAEIRMSEIPEIPGFPLLPGTGDLEFPTVEHAYRALKCLDIVEYAKFQEGLPGAAKKLGRRVKIRPDFEANKLAVMGALLRVKFKDPSLHESLKSTGNRLLVEGNNWNDRYWGISHNSITWIEREKLDLTPLVGCGDLEIPEVVSILSEYGHNHLGRILMKIRDPEYVDKWDPPNPSGHPGPGNLW